MQLRALPTILVVGAALAVIMLAACGTDEESAPTGGPRSDSGDGGSDGGRRLPYGGHGGRWRLLPRR